VFGEGGIRGSHRCRPISCASEILGRKPASAGAAQVELHNINPDHRNPPSSNSTIHEHHCVSFTSFILYLHPFYTIAVAFYYGSPIRGGSLGTVG
jgi:hypothetical protein